MGEVVSQAKFFIDGPMGNFQLFKVKSADVDDDQDTEVVTVVGKDRGAGFRDKPGGGSINLEVLREQGTPEVDYRREKRQKTKFAFTIQDTGGSRDIYFCRVAKVTRKSDDQGSHMDTVKLVWVDTKTLPTLPI
jgi:hypothetical protein